MKWIRENWRLLAAKSVITVGGGLFVASIVALVSGYPSYAVPGFAVLLVAGISCYYGWCYGRKQSSPCDFYDNVDKRCKFGIVGFYLQPPPTDIQALNEAIERYTWTGATAAQPAGAIRDKKSKRPGEHHRRCEYSFAVMDPELTTLVRAHARWEQKDCEIAQQLQKSSKTITEDKLDGSVRILLDYSEKLSKRFNVNLHPLAPTFRVIVSDKKAYVGFYESESTGPDSKQLVIQQIEDGEEDHCIFEWFKDFHDRHIEEAKRNIIVRKVLKSARNVIGEDTLKKIHKEIDKLAKNKPAEDHLIREAAIELGFCSP